MSEVDLTPIWYKEVALVGSIDHTIDRPAPGLAGGPDRHSVDRALDVLEAGLLPADVVVTHEFGLEDYRVAVETAIDRGMPTRSRSCSDRSDRSRTSRNG